MTIAIETIAVETVAVLALTYRTMWRNCYDGPEAVFDELGQHCEGFEGFAPVAPSGVSLIGLEGPPKLGNEDWDLIRLMDYGERVDLVELARDLLDADVPERCEALLHAWPTDPREQLAGEEWAESFLDQERWDEVAAAIALLEPTTWDREKVEEMALAAAATGWWNDPEFEEA